MQDTGRTGVTFRVLLDASKINKLHLGRDYFDIFWDCPAYGFLELSYSFKTQQDAEYE